MSLKQSVVIVSNFTNNRTVGSGSSNKKYGATPGNFVLRYMARDGATEDLTPVRYDTENFIMRYMAREDAVDKALSVEGLKQDMRDIQGDGGIAFGYGDFSLSHVKLKKASKDIQKCYDEGKTVMKTVISFDEEYLRQHHIIDDDFHLEQEGDYRGNIDQMKLRFAIMNGMERMGRCFDDLQYVGVIQVDTKHVHCHMVMVDKGKGTIVSDGTQRGKLTAVQKRELRRGIDMFLDDKQTVKKMSANVDYDRRNTICFVKKYTHKLMENRGFTQFLVACLPKDKSVWRADSNRNDMKKANTIVREYVSELFEQPDSGYREALHRVDQYARARQSNEGLSGKEYRELFAEGQRRILHDGMNSVYSFLRAIPDQEFSVRTPMMETMALPYEEMAAEADTDEMIEFGFKLRSYKTRLDHHKKEMHKYRDAAEEYRKQREEGKADEASKPLLDFFENEEDYNDKLMSKYLHFLSFLPPYSEYEEDLDALAEQEGKIDQIVLMRSDESMFRMKEDRAEDYGMRVYGLEGGHYMVTDVSEIDRRRAEMEAEYESMKEQYQKKLYDYGLVYQDDGTVAKQEKFDFDDVKALDLHHLLYDFPYDFKISMRNVNNFIECADRRYELYTKAKEYLEASGQSDLIETLGGGDIESQHIIAERFRVDDTMHTKREATAEQKEATRTISLDSQYCIDDEEQLKQLVKTTINSIQYDM